MEPIPELTSLSSDLSMYAARLVRLIRQSNPQAAAATRAMSILDQHGALTVTALAQLDNCSQPTMTGLVRQLADQGWLRRDPHPSDARSTLIELTGPGREELARVRAANGELVAARLAAQPQHSPAEVAAAVALLRDLLAEPATATPPPTPTKKKEPQP